jgi:hypothetical protein
MNEKAAEKCPRATRDIGVNLSNRGSAIKTAMYGPLNPSEPNTEYWDKLGKEWDVDAASAKKQLCGNCSLFIQTPSMKSCIEDGVTGGERKDEWEAIDGAGELGYCEAFDFKCASKRTCRAWVAGGPITEEKDKSTEKKSLDINELPKYDYFYAANPIIGITSELNAKAIRMRSGDTKGELLEWGEDYSDEVISLAHDEKSLKQWFKEKWVDISRPKPGGGFEPCGRDDAGKGKYPKCVPASKASKMTEEEIRSAVSRKRRAESTEQREDKKPIYVSTSKKDASSSILEKSAEPIDAELYARVKAEAKQKFDVYPSAYANAWLVREYKKRGGKYRKEEKELDGEYVENVSDLSEKQLSDFMEWVETKSARSPKRLKDPKGGLTAAGRAYFKRTQGSNLKPGVRGAADTPEKMRRKGSFLTRFFTNPSGPMKDEKGRSTRLALSAAAWGEPVPQDAQAAAKLAAKGRRLLERYEASKNKK